MPRKTDKYITKGSKGTDIEATRTNEGVAFNPAQYTPGTTTVDQPITGYNRLTLEEIDFLDKYAEHKADLTAIAAILELTKGQVYNMLKKEHLRRELAEIQEVWQLNRKMTAEHAAAKHIKLMNEMEEDYHKIDDPVERSKMANPRVKASETYLKAVGHFNHGNDTAQEQVIINIDLGGDPEAENKVKISGKKEKKDD